MKKHFVFFVALLACLFLLNTNIFSHTSVSPPQGVVDVVPDEHIVPVVDVMTPIHTDNISKSSAAGMPVFDFGSIKLKSAGMGKCTGVTLIPMVGRNVEVRSQRFVKSLWGSAARPGKVLSKWTELSPGGMRVKFDRAGGTHDHYKIFCRVKEGANVRTVECRDVVTLQDAKPGHCWSGPGSTDASFSPLNMTIKNK